MRSRSVSTVVGINENQLGAVVVDCELAVREEIGLRESGVRTGWVVNDVSINDVFV